MTVNRPSPVSAQPPPQIPSDKSISPQLNNYLDTFALWCRHGFAAKVDKGTASPGLLLEAYDAAPGATPTVWRLQVNTAGVISAVASPLGEGKP